MKYEAALKAVLAAEDYHTACDLVYRWVKESKIDEFKMADLIVEAHQAQVFEKFRWEV